MGNNKARKTMEETGGWEEYNRRWVEYDIDRDLDSRTLETLFRYLDLAKECKTLEKKVIRLFGRIQSEKGEEGIPEFCELEKHIAHRMEHPESLQELIGRYNKAVDEYVETSRLLHRSAWEEVRQAMETKVGRKIIGWVLGNRRKIIVG